MEPLITNRGAFKNYTLLDTYDAGVLLTGPEVKSLQNRRGSLEGSYVIDRGGELWLRKLYIHPYQENNKSAQMQSVRDRKLLLHAKEVKEILKQLMHK